MKLVSLVSQEMQEDDGSKRVIELNFKSFKNKELIWFSNLKEVFWKHIDLDVVDHNYKSTLILLAQIYFLFRRVLFNHLINIFAAAKIKHAALTYGLSLSPITAPFLTSPLKPSLKFYSIIYGNWWRKYEHRHMKSTTVVRNA